MITRRRFVNSVAALTAGLALPRHLFAGEADPLADRWGGLLPTRVLGRHADERVTIAALGGQHFRRLDGPARQPVIEAAIAGGVRFFDTAADYGRDQESEKLYGELLTPTYRDDIFLMSKSSRRDAEGARRDLDNSLRNMKTDRLDLWQVHTIESAEDVDRRWDNGVIDVFLEAREQGRARYIGFTGHKDIRAHQRMLDRLKERGVELDTCQMPVNVVDPVWDSFIVNILPQLVERGYAPLAMKTMVGDRLLGGPGEFGPRRGAQIHGTLIPGTMSFNEATHVCWSLPIATRIFGFDSLEHVNENIAAAKAYVTMGEERRAELLAKAKPFGGPAIEFYKRDHNNPDENF